MKLSANNLTKKFPKKVAVNNFNYEFEYGIYALLGPNGSGKSTLMRMVCDILRPSKGDVTLDGENISKMGENYRDMLGYLPQDFGYYPQFTAYDFLMYFASLKGYTKKEAKLRVNETLEQVSLMKEKKHKIKTFSRGMKQRLGIAQALLNNPKILVLDEPTAGLDPKERNKFKNILAKCAVNKTVIISTHIVSDVESLATKIILMKDGKCYLEGTRKDLLTTIEDKVYSFYVKNESEIDEKVIVTGITPVAEGIQVRAICDAPIKQSMHKEQANLEDLYLSVFDYE